MILSDEILPACVMCGIEETCSNYHSFGATELKSWTEVCKSCVHNTKIKELGTITLMTAASPDYAQLHEITAPSKISYAKRWGLKYKFREHVNITCWQRPEYWLTELEESDRQWLFWMGTDTLVMNPDIDCRSFIDTEYDLIIGLDVNGINNDIFFMQNSEASRHFLSEVLAARGHHENEQAAMAHLASQISGFKIKTVPQRQFNSYLYTEYNYTTAEGLPYRVGQYEEGDFILHFPGMSNERRIELANYYVQLMPSTEPKNDVIENSATN